MVQLNFTPEIKVFHVLFERCHTKDRKISDEQHMKCFIFQCNVQLDHPIEKSTLLYSERLPGFTDPVESRLLLGTSIMHADISKLLAPNLFFNPTRCICTFHRTACRGSVRTLRLLDLLFRGF